MKKTNLTENNESNRLLKHVHIKYHSILNNTKSGLIDLKYIKTSDNIADIFIKPLGKLLFQKQRYGILS